jgi:hypothetical protein
VFAFRGDPLSFIDLLPWLCATVFAVGLLVAAMYFLRFLRNWQADEPDNEQTMLTRFRDLHRKGELSAEEFREIRFRLAEQMQRRADEQEPEEPTH